MLSVAVIRLAALSFNAMDTRKINANVGMCCPRSIFPM